MGSTSLIDVDGTPLSADQQEEEKRKRDQETDRCSKESPQDHEHPVAKYQKEQNRDRRFMGEFTNASHPPPCNGRLRDALLRCARAGSD
jgi:hypothetical protein